MQVHDLLHETPNWKHSQYFFKHIDLRQWQPVLCDKLVSLTPLGSAVGLTLESKPFGFLSNITFMASFLCFSKSSEFSHCTHLHEEQQNALVAKHWQYLRRHTTRMNNSDISLVLGTYNFKHFDFLQWQVSRSDSITVFYNSKFKLLTNRELRPN